MRYPTVIANINNYVMWYWRPRTSSRRVSNSDIIVCSPLTKHSTFSFSLPQDSTEGKQLLVIFALSSALQSP
ncbi:hypothetical protein ACN38_g12354 [Penicillium nordicum]|uniref:Uncharacterized protein n=1 Tax=Penicillium nordicum TaxID=229535 RepID=A0A0N0RXG0_9EURO|nr:hypothetical protein ACN38_g12354 [Penicillium nordicum]